MTRALTRTHFHSSRLLRILTELACLQATPGAAFAEKLALWVDYTDAITLCAVHNASTPSTPAPQANGAPDWSAEFARQRAVLERAITAAKAPAMDLAEAAQLASQAGAGGLGKLELTSAFEPYRRHYLAQQRDMELKIPPLRARLREALGTGPAALQQLAALDAALDGILSEREGRLLASLPLLLKKRFAQLLQDHDAQQPGAWLARFVQELHTVLLAELDLRLQPALGLLEALGSQATPSPTPSPIPCTV